MFIWHFFFMFKFPLLYNMRRNRNSALIPSFTRHLHDVHCYFLPFCFSTKSLHATWICMIIHPFGYITAKTPAWILKDEGTLIWDHYLNWHMSVSAARRYLFSAHVFWIFATSETPLSTITSTDYSIRDIFHAGTIFALWNMTQIPSPCLVI